ncbi:copper resistance system multicopper oxidase [Gilvimarinus sp. F26214L]|uniref:copper resistance system multicopper oxidase n=1 Tax=Gilvimarinus sp. DZF01 TaxID=3461371 RepID=UPI0040466070
MKNNSIDRSRRRFVLGAGTLALSALPFARAAWASLPSAGLAPAVNTEPQLRIGQQTVNITGRERLATTINNSLPAPLLRWREGDRVRIQVRNDLDSTSSIHWHGLILPSHMDGVPGLSFDGIAPGKSFTYEFTLQQNGTYWYHSHSGFQEQTGLYGPIIIDPAEPEPFHFDREHLVVLSDWSDEAPEAIFAKLKKESHYYNFRARTVGDLAADVKDKGLLQTWRDRAMWNRMRMSDTDLADVTGYTYTYLMNGVAPGQGWQGLFTPGERVRLRVINAAAMTLFDIRIPGLKMTVVAADGQHVQPVDVDEFRIGPAETYDVIVEPEREGAYTIFAQSMDRSGFARGTLGSSADLLGEIPPMDPPPTLGHRDMGMDHGTAGNHQGHQASRSRADQVAGEHKPMGDHTGHAQTEHHQHGGAQTQSHGTHDMHKENAHHSSHAEPAKSHRGHGSSAPVASHLGLAGFGSVAELKHSSEEFGAQVDMRAESAPNGVDDPGIGLREHHALGRRVLRYSDLRGLHPTRDRRQPGREIQLHLTGNMERYLWSIDGVPFERAEPIELSYGERVRIHLVNDTMMVHPIHLHGLWSELETGDPGHIPRKHTVLVQPGSSISYLVTADAPGRWAFHCHLMYHMHGMMREVRVLPGEATT